MFTKKAYTYSFFLCLCFFLMPYHILASSTLGNNSPDKPSFQQDDHNKDESFINEDIFMEYMDKAAKDLPQLNSNNLVLFLGPTGAGKSTTICSLLFGKLGRVVQRTFFDGEWIELKPEIDVKDAKGKRHPKIGHKSAESCTVFPACYPLEGHDLDLCDFAGLFDSNGIEQRTAIAITSKQFLAQSKHIKAVVFMMSQSDLEAGRAHLMNQVIQGLTKMFANPLAHVDSIFFALTKSNYSAATFKYAISELKNSIKKQKDKSGINNSKTLYDLLDTMLTKHKEHFLLVNPLKEESSELIIKSLKQSKGFPSKAIRFIGDREINRASYHFFTKCAKEGMAILKTCNTYPSEIKNKTKEISYLKLDILNLSQSIDDYKNNKEQKKRLKELLANFQADVVQAENNFSTFSAEKAAKEKYISDYDNGTLVEVGSKIVIKEEMNLVRPWIEYQYRIIDVSLTPDNGSYCDVRLEFNKHGYIVKESRLKDEYKATYRCYEDGGSNLTITLLEQSCVRYRAAIAQAMERIPELKETKMPEQKIAIAVAKAKVSLMEEFLAMGKNLPKEDLIKQLEARQDEKKSELVSSKDMPARMRKELINTEKTLFKKLKLFNVIAQSHKFLGFTYGDIADFVREYKKSKNRVEEVIAKIKTPKVLLTFGYIRQTIKALPPRENIQYSTSDNIYRLILAYYLGR